MQKANDIMAKIHNTKLRMPFILPKGAKHEWLNVNLSEKEIAHMMKPLENGLHDALIH